MKYIRLLYILYSLVFYGFAFFYFESFLESLLLFIFIFISSHVITYDFFNQTKLAYDDAPSFVSFDVFLLVISFLPIILFFTFFGIPLFSEDPEKTRVYFEEQISIYARIYPTLIIAANSFFAYELGKHRKVLFFCVSLFLGITVFYFSGYRSRIIDLIILSILVFVFSRYGQKISIRKILLKNKLLFSTPIIGVFLIYLQTQARFDDVNIFRLLVDRIFLLNYQINIERIYSYVDIFSHEYGASYWKDIISVFSKDVQSFSKTITLFNNSENLITTMTPTIYGEAYLNFGIFYPLSIFMIMFVKLLIDFIVYTAPGIKKSGNFTLCFFISIVYVFSRTSVTLGIIPSFLIKVLPALAAYYFFSFMWIIWGGKLILKFKSHKHKVL